MPNRRSLGLLEVFKEHIYPESVIVTDGYPSYPQAVNEFGSIHEVINHSLGFVTASGVNTNQIENLWYHLKQDYRVRYGLNHDRIGYFLEKFTWEKKNIIHADLNTHKIGFTTLLEKFKIIN